MKPGADETSDVIGYLNYQCEQCGVSFMIRVYRRNYEGSEWQHGLDRDAARSILLLLVQGGSSSSVSFDADIHGDRAMHECKPGVLWGVSKLIGIQT